MTILASSCSGAGVESLTASYSNGIFRSTPVDDGDADARVEIDGRWAENLGITDCLAGCGSKLAASAGDSLGFRCSGRGVWEFPV